MTGIPFAILGVAMFFALVLPASALVARGALAILERLAPGGLHTRHRLRYGVLLASSAVPLTFFVSAGVHQMEWGGCAELCARCHEAVTACPEAVLLVIGLLGVVAILAAPRLAADRAVFRAGDATDATRFAATRVDALISRDDRLAPLRARVTVRHAGPPMATHGFWLPRISISERFVSALDDEALSAALQHELEHVRGRDPLRYFLASWALYVNPFGHLLLGAELRRWILAREAHCDRGAVAAGASAPALAQALVSAARPPATQPLVALPGSAALGDADADSLRLRVSLLLGYADSSPKACCDRSSFGWLGAVVVLVAVLPHLSAAPHLDAVHAAADVAARALGAFVGAGS